MSSDLPRTESIPRPSRRPARVALVGACPPYAGAAELLALVRRAADGGFEADLRVKGATVVFVREDDLDRFRQRLKEQITIHVSRDQQPDLIDP